MGKHPCEHPKAMLTADRLRQVLAYDPDSGVFTRRVRTCNKVKVGDVAGSHDTHGYILISVDGKRYLAHRLAWLYETGAWPEKEIDHVNGVRDDNRMSNLREATSAENKQNRAIQKNNTSGLPGVGWREKAGMWRARVYIDGQEINAGFFDTLEKAANARAQAKAEVHKFHPVDREPGPR